ncbi:cytochrome c oxidase subunit 3 family protein [Melittangium boletus]|uniref:Cytochrome c oxidase polypeptide III n=1 Tax=Melittangium boletus DSM 14713 TaxID=1294270 RepID=A0A250IEW2_9BACT|nr:cytochrome c oxidase subunit 3 family protein [Melittangium boletus]ATB29788.1 cytochrome c oxidase polypeptide III [Melittangium boletus DSM 14713]
MSTEASPWREYFGGREKQSEAAQLGMWIFLGSEVLLFANLFVGYALYRYYFPEVFIAASKHLKAEGALVQTLLLVTSSLFVVLAVHFIRQGKQFSAAGVLLVAILLGVGFLVIKGWEYWEHWKEGALPGEYYRLEDLPVRGGSLFFTLYFLLTGLHALHMLVALGVLGWLVLGAMSGKYTADYHVPVEVGGLYWHLVDIFWLFIFPLLYLVE